MLDLQEEECEVLRSIYDEKKLSVSDKYCFEYMIGENGSLHSFIVQIQWPEGYPDIAPKISMDAFYNGHIPSTVKQTIIDELVTLANENLGTALTFTLIEHLRDNQERYIRQIKEESAVKVLEETSSTEQCLKNPLKLPKAPKLSKAQKRKQFDKLGQNGELPRGWNWVSVIKHLQQTGSLSET